MRLLQLITVSIPNCYELDTKGSTIKQRLYIGGDAYSAPAVYVNNGSSWSMYYICRDYLGSITHLVNSSGVVQQELSYDAWGRLRNPSNQQVYLPGNEPELFLGRGYTGHEHLPMFGLINMNARLYDPAIGRFLSPDPYVQAPDFSQNFNRYSYALNNPLKYTDPDGEFVLFAVGAVIGAYIGGVATNKGELNPFSWDYKSPVTYLGMGFGAIFGGYGAYAIVNPGSFAFAGSLGSPWVTGGVSVTSLGMGTDWRYNFHWSTAAGGGGEYGKINDPANIADKAISNAQRQYKEYYSEQSYDFSTPLGFATGAISEAFFSRDLGTWMGKDFKIRSQTWGGNQYTGGKYKFADNMAKPFRIASGVFGLYGMIRSVDDHRQGRISVAEATGDVLFGLASIYSGFWGGIANGGYVLGKEYGPISTSLRLHQQRIDEERRKSIVIEYMKEKGYLP